MRQAIIGAAIAVLLASAGSAAAQTTIESSSATPTAAQTVEYDGFEIVPDPNLGPVQCVVWVRDETRHADPRGVTMTAAVDGVVIFHDSDLGWLMVGHAKRNAVDEWNLQQGEDCTAALLGEKS